MQLRQFGENRLGCAREGILEWLWDGVAVRIPPISALRARYPSPDGPLAGLCVRIANQFSHLVEYEDANADYVGGDAKEKGSCRGYTRWHNKKLNVVMGRLERTWLSYDSE